MKISIGYPDARDELEILFNSQHEQDEIKTVAQVDDILELRRSLKDVHISRPLAAYIVTLVAETRRHENVQLGASVRGTLALAQVAKASALLDSREYVIPDDIHRWLNAVLSHRMILKRGAAQHRITIKQVLDEIKQSLRVPK